MKPKKADFQVPYEHLPTDKRKMMRRYLAKISAAPMSLWDKLPKYQRKYFHRTHAFVAGELHLLPEEFK